MAVMYLCPADKRLLCSWEGYASDIKQHFEKEHQGLLFYTNSIEIDINISHENVIVSLNGEIYLIQYEIIGTKLFIKLRFLGPVEQASTKIYDVFITVEDTSYRYNRMKSSQIIIPTNEGWQIDLEKLTEIHENFEILTCIISVRTNLAESREMELRRNESLRINNYMVEKNFLDDFEQNYLDALSFVDQKLDKLKKENENDDFMDRISLLNLSILEEPFSKNRKASVDEIKKESAEFHEDLPDIFEELHLCYRCQNDMLPPIYLCPNGHSVCVSCRKILCLCGTKITDLRNTELENISRTHKHPCRYIVNGCMEKLFYNEVRAHETKCKFCQYSCPLDCSFEGKFSLFGNHLKIQHSSVRITRNLSNDFPKDSEFFIANKDKGIFYCKSEMKEDVVSWTVTFCGPKERRFFCELNFKGWKGKDPVFMRKRDNLYETSKTKMELKKMKAKEKNAILIINCYEN